MKLRHIASAILAVALFSCAPLPAVADGPINEGTLLKQLYGLTNAPNCFQTTLTVTNQASRMRPNSAARITLDFFNPGSQLVYLWFDPTVSTTKGINLISAGGHVGFNFREDATLPTFEFWAISAGLSTTIYASECDVQ